MLDWLTGLHGLIGRQTIFLGDFVKAANCFPYNLRVYPQWFVELHPASTAGITSCLHCLRGSRSHRGQARCHITEGASPRDAPHELDAKLALELRPGSPT